MKKTLLYIGALLLSSSINAQTTILFEDFESGAGAFTLNTADLGGVVGTGGDNFWTVNNTYVGGAGTIMFCTIALGSPFTVGATPAQPGGISSTNGGYLHVLSEEANANNITNANYGLAENTFCIFTASHFTSMTNDVNTTAFTGVTLDFWWLNNADAAAQGELWYSTDGGISWVPKIGTIYQGVSTWTNDVLTDPDWDGQTQLRFGWRFNNGASTGGADPAFSIDDIEITGTLGSPCTDSNSSYSIDACFTYTVPSGDETYNTVGTQTVMDTILNVSGCDSVMTIVVTIDTVNNSITDNGDATLTANSLTATYQWLSDCNGTSQIVSGETSQTLNVLLLGVPGYYSVIVTENGCVDTSDCILVEWGNLVEFNSSSIEVYPNPSNGSFSIKLNSLKPHIKMSINDINGKLIMTETYYNTQNIDKILFEGESGVYIITLVDSEGNVMRAQLIKE